MLVVDMIIIAILWGILGFLAGRISERVRTVDYKQRWQKAIAILDTDEVAQALIEHNVWYDKAQGKAGKAHTMPKPNIAGLNAPQLTPKQEQFMNLRAKEAVLDWRLKVKREERDKIVEKVREDYYKYNATPPAYFPHYNDRHLKSIPTKTTSDWSIKYLDNP